MLNIICTLCGRFIVLGVVVFVVAPIVFVAKLAGAVAGVLA